MAGPRRTVALAQALSRDWPADVWRKLRDASVLVHCSSALSAALSLLQLDGLVRRMVLCPPGADIAQILQAAEVAQTSVVVSDLYTHPALAHLPHIAADRALSGEPASGKRDRRSEWVLFTSGSTGTAKLVVHTLETLTARFAATSAGSWGTFYDIRRYGGLVIFLRALLSGATLVAAEPGEAIDDYLTRVRTAGCRRLTGTPSHWRRALISPALSGLELDYVRLSGEIADQAILDKLRARFPEAKIVHAFASTEAGLAFEVDDGREGFPDSVLGASTAQFQIKVEDGTLRVRSPGAALRMLGGDAPLCDAQGFIDTRDAVHFREGRYRFEGRRDGVINVGGNKIHPEEIEAVLNRHPLVQLSRVRSRKNPILGALAEAEVVLGPGSASAPRIHDDLIALCAAHLPPHKRPVAIRFIESLPLSQSGKLDRAHA
ncbi:MAG: long-chain fatty acid--CoA ligase [Alphaproteobacteria bacterium]|nr:long-chain fatty acid--CoA ligase [Alphaproteobacteria bacterium]